MDTYKTPVLYTRMTFHDTCVSRKNNLSFFFYVRKVFPHTKVQFLYVRKKIYARITCVNNYKYINFNFRKNLH